MASLDASLVENPVRQQQSSNAFAGMQLGASPEAALDDVDVDAELAPLPDYFVAVRAHLWTPDGTPRRVVRWLYGIWYFYLAWATVVYPIIVLLGYATADDLEQMVIIGPVVVLMGLVPLHTLCVVARPGGHLDQLGAYVGTLVPTTTIKSLKSWKRGFKIGWLLLNFVMITASEVFVFGSQRVRVCCGAGNFVDNNLLAAAFAMSSGNICVWWFSLKVAAALTKKPARAASSSIKAMISRIEKTTGSSSSRPMIDEIIGVDEWYTEVELPVLKLARTTLPTLNDGWGRSVAFVGTAQSLRGLRDVAVLVFGCAART